MVVCLFQGGYIVFSIHHSGLYNNIYVSDLLILYIFCWHTCQPLHSWNTYITSLFSSLQVLLMDLRQVMSFSKWRKLNRHHRSRYEMWWCDSYTLDTVDGRRSGQPVSLFKKCVYIYLFIFTGGWLIRRKFIPIHRRVSYTSQVVVWRSSSNSKFCKSLIGAKKLDLSVYLTIYNLLSFRRVVRELWTSRLDTDMMQKKKSPCNWHESFSTR